MGQFLVAHGAKPRPRREGFPTPMLGPTGTKRIWDDVLEETIEVPTTTPAGWREALPAQETSMLDAEFETMTMEQGTEEWFQARLGIITASQFGTLMMKGRGGADSKTRQTYMNKLAGEILTGQPMDTVSNYHMERGKALEPEARGAYQIISGNEVEEVGFIRCLKRRAGASPDGLIGDRGGLEIKTMLPHILIDCHESGRDCPKEHYAQVQGGMWITGRQWWDFVGYWPGMPVFIARVERDDDFIAALAEEAKLFNLQLDRMVEKYRAMM